MPETAQMEPIIRCAQLTRRFGQLSAVRELSFEVAPGELFGIVGPDGAGKTTTLRMLAGVLRPTAGDATVRGESIAHNAERAKHHIAYMPQRFGLYSDLTVRENIDFYADLFLVPKRERQPRIRRLFEFSGLEPFSDRLAGSLSGGMKQKLGLSCALVHEPEVLLLDEPTFGVDPVSRRDLWIIIHEMVARGVTVVVSTSYMDEAERFDRLALLNRGAIIALDTPERLLASFEGQLLSVRTSRPREAKRACSGVSGVRSAAVFGDRLHVSTDGSAGAEEAVRTALQTSGIDVGEITPSDPSLENVFIQRIGEADDDA